jgi:hypothetical protein
MLQQVIKVVVSAVIIVAVSQIAQRAPRWGALILTLPIISVLAFVMTWHEHHDLRSVSRLARETLVLVPLGLPFFVPLAFSLRWGLGFWPAMGLGLLLAAGLIAAWMHWGPRQI